MAPGSSVKHAALSLQELLEAEQARIRELEDLLKGKTVLECRHNMHTYVKNAWTHIDGAKFIDNWHIEAICLHLEAIAKREIRQLLIMQPPRMAKSQISSVCFPTWVWLTQPSEQIFTASYDNGLAERDSWKSRLLIESPWYQSNWGEVFQLSQDSNKKKRYDNNCNGYRLAASTGSASTGHGYDILIIDDPHKATDVHSKAKREAVLDWYTNAMSTRANNPDTAVKVVIGQRLHYHDLIGHLLDSGEWEVLKLPMEYVPSVYVTSIGWSDPRTRPGELLFPARYNEEAVRKLKKELKTSLNISAQLQQEPVPPDGGMIKRDWLVPYFDEPLQYDLMVSSWDLAFGEATEDGSYCVGMIIGKKGHYKYIVDVIRERMDFTRQKEAILNITKQYPQIRHHLIEGKASGTAIGNVLKRDVQGLVMIDPNKGFNGGSKEERLQACLFEFELGNVLVPSEKLIRAQKWVNDLIEELVVFPRGGYFDQVDALTQALNWFNSRNTFIRMPGEALGVVQTQAPPYARQIVSTGYSDGRMSRASIRNIFS